MNASMIAEQTIRTFLGRADKDTDITLDTPLFADGLGLDSLQTAELSVMLEDEVGRDPFSDGLLPATVGEILDFYREDFQPQP
jgi:acyl carrier protein